jgi:hypothetical protein
MKQVFCKIVVVLTLMMVYEYKKLRYKDVVAKENPIKERWEREIGYDQTSRAVQPSQWILPRQTKTAEYNCTRELDWSDKIKCPGHHPYIWSKMYTKHTMSSTLKYKGGVVQCSIDTICSNIYDVDAPGEMYQ